MAKLKLNLDQLTVDSFDTSSRAEERGTVFGEQCTCQTVCTCPGCPTCDPTQCGQETCATCQWDQQTCNFSCEGSCWYTECPSNRTCDPTVVMKECCPY